MDTGRKLRRHPPPPSVLPAPMRLSSPSTTRPSPPPFIGLLPPPPTSQDRINARQSDAAIYSTDQFGGGCAANLTNPGFYDSCVAGEEQTAQGALGDENAANAAEKGDVSKQVTSVQQIESAINAFVQQLDGATWPPAVAPVVASLTQALGNYRGAYAQAATDIAGGQLISAASQAITAAQSAVSTQLTAMAAALGIPPSSTPGST